MTALASVAAVNADEYDKPAALLAAQEARRWATAEIDWSVAWNAGDYKGREFHYTSRVAGEDFVLERRGDDDGVVMYDTTGKPAVTAVTRELCTGDAKWVYEEGALACHAWEGGDIVRSEDVRSVGLLPNDRLSEVLEETLWTYPESTSAPRRYSERIEDGVHVVTATLEGTDAQIIWHINEQKGWNVERVAILESGEVKREALSSLRKFGDRWFPVAVEYRSGGQPEPTKTFYIQRAEFDQPQHARQLAPADIGVESGLNVIVATGPRRGGWRWDGSGLVTSLEFLRRLRAGEVETSPKIRRVYEAHRNRQRAAAGGGGGGEAKLASDSREPRPTSGDAAKRRTGGEADRRLADWEEYARRFIKKYQLDEAQTAKALGVLKECQGQANRYLKEHQAEFDRADKRSEAAAKATGAEATKQREALAPELAKLRAPLDAIFERRLKPRLDKLPTRAQRRAAGEDESAKPGKP